MITTQEYAAKRADKQDRLEAAADRARAESQRRYAEVRRIGDGIPMGQPILVGHHSEKRHRRDIARIDSNMRKSIELDKVAGELAARAARIDDPNAPISSDDPDAVEKLEAKLADMQAKHATNVAINKLVRKKDIFGLAAMGFSENLIAKLLEPVYGEVGIPKYVLSNSNGNMKRVKDRIESLRRTQNTPVMEAKTGVLDGYAWELYEDEDDNRLVIKFDGKPSPAILASLRSAGFKWSPTRVAHVRQRSNGATYQAQRLLGISA